MRIILILLISASAFGQGVVTMSNPTTNYVAMWAQIGQTWENFFVLGPQSTYGLNTSIFGAYGGNPSLVTWQSMTPAQNQAGPATYKEGKSPVMTYQTFLSQTSWNTTQLPEPGTASFFFSGSLYSTNLLTRPNTIWETCKVYLPYAATFGIGATATILLLLWIRRAVNDPDWGNRQGWARRRWGKN